MEKTSREYAEKLAAKAHPNLEGDNNTLFNEVQAWCRISYTDGYLKAVEETNVKELRESIGEIIKKYSGDELLKLQKQFESLYGDTERAKDKGLSCAVGLGKMSELICKDLEKLTH